MKREETQPESEVIPLKEYSEKAYLDYSMYVILSRALPHIADGLKPVQRRIVYAMSELSLHAGAKHKKSARTVGDVIGKFHPHGDASVYAAIALLAQDFSTRYPLIDGQGNWGSIDDPSSFAAMRYTEARLTAFASETLLGELRHGAVDWRPNFDDTLKEPALLPAQAPNLLVNGSSGIAVGMSADIPAHNLCEVVEACVRLLEAPRSTLEDICQLLPAPDPPGGAEIVTPREELREIYRIGKGRFKMRAVWREEKGAIVVTALPHQTSTVRIREKMGQLMEAGKLPMVADVRDESDHEQAVRLVIEPAAKRADLPALMEHLCATTELEHSYPVNCNVIGLDGRPAVKPLLTLLREWLEFRKDQVTRRLRHRLEEIEERLHLLAGLLIAHLSIDEVIAVIRSEDHPAPVLMRRFGLSEEQAKAILEIRLRQLSKLEEIKLRGERDELEAERAGIERTLGSQQRLKTLIKKELQAIAKRHGDPRRSALVERQPAQALSAEQLAPREAVTVILSRQGWVRAARGHDKINPEKLSHKGGDSLLATERGYTDQPMALLDSSGRSYALLPGDLPSARGYGEPLSSRLNLAAGARFSGLIACPPGRRALLCSDAGYGFVADCEKLLPRSRSGKALIALPPGAEPLPPRLIPAGGPQGDPQGDLEGDEAGDVFVAALSRFGNLLVFPLGELAQMSSGKGSKMLAAPSGKKRSESALMRSAVALGARDTLLLDIGRGIRKLKPDDWLAYVKRRGLRGTPLPSKWQSARRLETLPTS